MAINQNANCVNKKNTGLYGCEVSWQNVVGEFQAFQPLEFDGADPDALLVALKAAINNDDPYQRLYPVQNFDGATANNEDTVTTTASYGNLIPVRPGKYDVTYTYHDGGIGKSNTLYGFDGPKYFLQIASPGILVGRKGSTPNKIKMIRATYKEGLGATPNLGAEAMGYSLRRQWNKDDTNINVATVDFRQNGGLSALTDLAGLVDITLVLANRTANVVKVKTLAGFGGIDIYSNYKATLAAAGAWVAKNKATGAAITITSVTQDDNLGAYTITLDNTDPDYTGTVGGILINLAAVSVISNATYNVTGFEGVAVTV